MFTSAREVALLANRRAGRGRSSTLFPLVSARLRAGGLRVRELVARDGDHARTLAALAVATGVDGLVVIGGDGSVNLGLQVVAGTDVPLGIVPTGTGNDAARYFDLPLRDPVAATDLILRGRTRTVDLARTGDRWFITVLAAGFDAVVSERAAHMTWPRGQMRYNVATVAELRTFRPLSYSLDVDGVTHELDAMLVAVGNGPSFGGGLRITEGALLDDGLLDVVVIKPLSRLELVRTYPKLFTGTHVTHPQYQRFRARRVTVAASGVVGYADGERIGSLPLTVECIPRAVKVWS